MGIRLARCRCSLNSDAIFSLGGDAWSTAGDDQHTATEGQSSPSVTTDYNLAEKGESNDNVIGFQCGKCSLKFKDTESFREHAEKCFN